MLNKYKKSQASGAAAATLVAIIAALIILYLLALSPEDRERILEGGESYSEENYPDLKDGNMILLAESPERVYPGNTDEFEKSFSPVNLYTKEEAVQLKQRDELYIKRALFSQKKESVNFEVADINDVKEVLLNFVIQKSKGKLIIDLNGHEIYNNEIETININPIDLKKEGFLLEGLNEVEFSVSSPGMVFWKTNEFNLEDVSISATTFFRDSQTSSQMFIVTEEDKMNLKNLRLRFNTECTQSQAGKLDIWLNDYSLFSGVPDCGQPNRPIEFLPSKLIVGENELRFRAEEGRVLVDHITLTSSLREAKPKTYYFEIEEKYFYGEKDSDREYKYYCGNDARSIELEYKGNIEKTGWKCDEDETCVGNFKRYSTEEDKGTVTGDLCEEEDYGPQDYKYYCGSDGESIYLEHDDIIERTGWSCISGEICEGTSQIYDEEKSKSSVRDNLCYDEGYGTFMLDRQLDAVLYIRFEDDVSRKQAEVRVNGHSINIDQRAIEFESSIRNYVEEGTNAIKIIPNEILDIAELEITLES